jgi:hypothetical protein
MRDFDPAYRRFGSFSIEPPAAASPVLSAVPPIAAEFRAPQRMTVSADIVAKVQNCPVLIFPRQHDPI